MSILPPEVGAELAQLLQALQSADNNVRSQAEDHLQNNWTATRPEILLMGFVEQIMGSSDDTVSRLPRLILNKFDLANTMVAIGTLFCRCHIPTDRFQDAQVTIDKRKHRPVHILDARSCCRHSSKALGGFQRGDGQGRQK
jgi:hypothetical protein